MGLFTKDNNASVAALGEIELLRQIRAWLGECSPPPPFGIGDDCAVINVNQNELYQIATTDSVVLNRHFTESDDPKLVGEKLLKRNISDIGGMGGKPASALMNLFVSRDLSVSWLKAFYEGISQYALKYKITIIGGDIAELPAQGFCADMTLLGYGSNLKTRKTARLNDIVFVTGELGGSILKKHLEFTPRLAEGQWLAQQEEVSAMLDLTDGLAKDLPELCMHPMLPGVHLSKLPIAEDCVTVAKKSGKAPNQHAMSDGEDYEIVFTLDGRTEVELFLQKWHQHFEETSISMIGRIVQSKEDTPQRSLMNLDTNELIRDIHGYEHLDS